MQEHYYHEMPAVVCGEVAGGLDVRMIEQGVLVVYTAEKHEVEPREWDEIDRQMFQDLPEWMRVAILTADYQALSREKLCGIQPQDVTAILEKDLADLQREVVTHAARAKPAAKSAEPAG